MSRRDAVVAAMQSWTAWTAAAGAALRALEGLLDGWDISDSAPRARSAAESSS